MKGQKRNISISYCGAIVLALSLFVLSLPPVTAQTTEVRVQKALPNITRSSNYGWRSRNGGQVHDGTDIASPMGTNVTFEGAVSKCYPQPVRSGYGTQARIDRGCGVMELFSHLSACTEGPAGTGRIVTGNSPPGTATHLHWEVLINRMYVDGDEAAGQNLCDSDVRTRLLESARNKRRGQNSRSVPPGGGGGGSTAASSEPAPTSSGSGSGSSVTQVPTGETDPNTGQKNEGPAYYIMTAPDGTVTREYDVGSTIYTSSILPPTETTNLVMSGGGGSEISGCATDTWRAMVNQAILQTRREDMMNKRFIAKPDSVFTYSCFTETLVTAGNSLGILSTSQDWANRSIDILGGNNVTVQRRFADYSLEGAMTSAIIDAYNVWMGHFNYGALGGQLQPTITIDPDNLPEENLSSIQAYMPCGAMAEVWKMAKCMVPTDANLFPKFEDLTNNNSDPRKYPQVFACFDTGITQSMIDTAQNKEAKFDKIDTHFSILSPTGGGCSAPVATGVTITVKTGSGIITTERSYEDGVCLSPGCSYVNSGSGSGQCQVKNP